MIKETIYDMLIRHEGLKLKPYLDTVGKLTIGVGRNLEDNGITEQEAFDLLRNDVYGIRMSLNEKIPWWRTQPELVQMVLINMAFQLGPGGLFRFKRFLGALERKAYAEAAKEMLRSKWATQTPRRAKELAAIVAAS